MKIKKINRKIGNRNKKLMKKRIERRKGPCYYDESKKFYYWMAKLGG